MTDRWNPKRVTVPNEKPARVFVASAPSGSVEPRGKTWGIRVRGDVSKRAPQVYRCPVHGEFSVEVPLDAVPDEAWCRKAIDAEIIEMADGAVVGRANACGMASPWSGSPCGIGHAAGEVRS